MRCLLRPGTRGHKAPMRRSASRSSWSPEKHIHSRIDTAELPVSHLTRRQGRPYTLVLTKTDALFAQEQKARIRDESDLEWLEAKWAPGAQPERSPST